HHSKYLGTASQHRRPLEKPERADAQSSRTAGGIVRASRKRRPTKQAKIAPATRRRSPVRVLAKPWAYKLHSLLAQAHPGVAGAVRKWRFLCLLRLCIISELENCAVPSCE